MSVTIPNKKYCVWRIRVWGPLSKMTEIPECIEDLKQALYTVAVYKMAGIYELWCHRKCEALDAFSGDTFVGFFETERKSMIKAKETWKKACKGDIQILPSLPRVLSYDTFPLFD